MLIHGDSLEKIKEIENNSIDLIVTDPPYGINYKDWDTKEFSKFTEFWISESIQKLKDNGTMWVFMSFDNLFTHKFCEKGLINILQSYGFINFNNIVTWARQKGRCSSKHLKSTKEIIVHFTKKDKDFVWNNLKVLRDVIAPYKNEDGTPRGWFIDENGNRKRWTGMGNVWTYTSPSWSAKFPDNQIHPAQKPIMMIERLILLSSNENDLIFDPFMGVGTTGIACKRLKRQFIGIEKNKEFFEIAKERIKIC